MDDNLSMKRLTTHFEDGPNTQFAMGSSSFPPNDQSPSANNVIHNRTCPHCKKVFARSFSISKHTQVSAAVQFEKA